MKSLTIAITTLSLCSLPALAAANAPAFDRAMGPIFTRYAKIRRLLAADKSKGVAGPAKQIAKLARKLPTRVAGAHAGHYKMLPKKIKAAATALAKARGMVKQREAFKRLSRPLALWATMSKPAGINVVFCSMAKASWLQRGKKIRNPYYGAKMLRCGEIVSGAHKGTKGGHMKHR